VIQKSGAAETPKKKRKLNEYETPVKEFDALKQQSSDTRNDINSVANELGKVRKSVSMARGQVDELRWYSSRSESFY